jgi:hypothetical protein
MKMTEERRAERDRQAEDREIKSYLRQFKGRQRAAMELWVACCRKAGLPWWMRPDRGIGPHDIRELRERLADDPATLDVFEDAYRLGCVEWAGRCAGKIPFTPDPLPKGGWPEGVTT